MSRRLLKSTAVVSVYTLLSRILGFVRDMVVARFFGAGLITDAFYVAFRIPNLLRRLFAEGAFSQAFVPVLGEYRQKNEHKDVQQLVQRVAGTLGVVLIVVTILGVLGAPALVYLFAPGFSGDETRFDLTVSMLRLTFPYLFFISLTAFAGGILNTYGRFAVPAFTPVLLNVCMITAAIFISPMFEQPIMALAVGVFAAGILQLVFQLPFLYRLKLLSWPKPDRKDEGVRRILRLMLPAMFGSSVAQINLLLDTLIASFLITGSVSWLYYSDRLMEFPLGVFAIALATVILPSLSRQHADQDSVQFNHTLDWALRWAILIGLPAAAALMFLSAPLLTTLFQYGEFQASDVVKSTISLQAYSIGLLGFILVKVLVPAFYARQDTRTPVKVGIIAMTSNMALNIVIVIPLILFWFDAPHAGLALATSLGAFVNAGLLFRNLRSQGIYQPQPGWFWLWCRIIFATVVMSWFLIQLSGTDELWLTLSAGGRSWRLAWLVFGGAGVYGLVLLVSGVWPWRWRSTEQHV